jgi:microcompartment protein CcmK/EutM
LVLGKVVGTVWATRKDENLVGLKFMVVKHIDLDYKEKEQFIIAVDSVQAGIGDTVLVTTGSSARQTELTKNKSIDAVIMAVVDKLDISKKD